MFCHPISSTHTMKADVYEEIVTQGRSGQPLRTFEKVREIRCLARGILGQGIRVVGSSEQFLGTDYEDVEVVKIRTTDKNLHKGLRIGDIRSQQGETLWKNQDGPIIFKVQGVTPVFDPFNTIIEYDVLLRGVTGD